MTTPTKQDALQALDEIQHEVQSYGSAMQYLSNFHDKFNTIRDYINGALESEE